MENDRARNKWSRLFPFERVRTVIRSRAVFLDLAAGLILGVIAVTVSTAFAALIFSGELSPYLPAGVGLMLVGSILVGGFLALFSSVPNIVGGLQDTSIAIFSLTTLVMLKDLPAETTLEQKFSMVVAGMALSSLLTGVLFLLLGHFKLGKVVYLIPYPVMGGFLAGSGLLLVFGGLGLLINQTVNIWRLPLLFSPGRGPIWLPGLGLAVVLVALQRRFQHPLMVMVVLFGATLIFYGCLWLSGISLKQAVDQGWLLGAVMKRSGGLWMPSQAKWIIQVNWGVMLRHSGSLVELAIVNLITLLLNATGIEMVTGNKLDLNRELNAAGFANLAAGLFGAFGGTHTISDSILSHKIGARSRLVGISLAGFCVLVLLTGFNLLAFFPRLILGGLLISLGLDFLFTWVYEVRRRLSRMDYLTVILIMMVINTEGLLPGLGVGLGMAMVLFVISYSRTEVVSGTLTGSSECGSSLPSPVSDPSPREQGESIFLLNLKGYLFFGTANKLLERVRECLDQPCEPPQRFIILDFSQVSGLDASAVFCFSKMVQLARAEQSVLLFTQLQPEIERRLRSEALSVKHQEVWHIEADLNDGVKWCEDQRLA